MSVRVHWPVFVLAAAGLLAWAGGAAAAETQRANFVIIFVDDMGYGELGCYGHPRFETPALDRMAAEGVRCTDFYVPMPYCAPSRASILTGRYPFRHGIVRNPCPGSRYDELGIADDELTLGEALQAAGYATACIGKWHLGHKPRFYPRRHGLDEYFGILHSNDPSMRPVQLFDGDRAVEYPVVQCLLTKRYTERALQFIERNKDRPFFVYLAHAMPHIPLAPSEQFYKKSGAGLYGDVVAELDWSVGQILWRLKRLGLDERTLVIFTSDNGPWFGGSTGGLRGMKGQTWEGGIRVPMIARWPGKIPASRVCRDPACTIDIFPTVLKAAGVPLPDDRTIDGKDILPMLAGTAPSPHEALFAMFGPDLMTVRSGKWKLHVRPPTKWPRNRKSREDLDRWLKSFRPDGVTILAPYEQYLSDADPDVRTGDPPQPMMLFDLESDPAEQHNVAGQHPEVVNRLRALFDRMAP